jgi:cytochrome c biogenesis protein CcmG, thiol:disulfide interchange protein DsbE
MSTKRRFLALMLGLVAAPAAAHDPKIGEPAPNFELTLVDGSKVTLDQLRGEVVVLNFWATWCGPCKTELPVLDTYYKLRKDHGLRVFAITTEDSLPLYKLKTLFNVMKIPAVKRIHGPYAILSAVPTNYVIDRAGTIRYAKAAAFNLQSLDALLVPLLNERAPAAVAPKPAAR